MNSREEFEEWYVLEVSGCNGEYVMKFASGEYLDRDTNKAWQVWQAAKESCAAEITVLKAECEYDQRNAAQSQRETLRVIKENEELKARIAEMMSGKPVAWMQSDHLGKLINYSCGSQSMMVRCSDHKIQADFIPLFSCSVPAGYQLVPVEPTLAMLKAAYDHRESDEYTGIESVYEVMLQAAKGIKP